MAGRYVHRCPECRTRRVSFKLLQQHMRDTGHKVCDCGGYHYRHRKGSPFCRINPLSAILEADRQGNDEETLLAIAASITAEQPELAGKVQELCEQLRLTNH